VDDNNDAFGCLGSIIVPSDNGEGKIAIHCRMDRDGSIFFGVRDKDYDGTECFTMSHGFMISDDEILMRCLTIDWQTWVEHLARHMRISEESAAELDSFVIANPTQLAYEVVREAFGPEGAELFVDPAAKRTGWPRLWELLGYALPRRTRERLFAPSFADLMRDYMTTRQAKYQTRGARLWLNTCFTIHTGGLILLCIGIAIRSAAIVTLLLLIPQGIRERVWDWWCHL
jgi:hypothetical protein